MTMVMIRARGINRCIEGSPFADSADDAFAEDASLPY